MIFSEWMNDIQYVDEWYSLCGRVMFTMWVNDIQHVDQWYSIGGWMKLNMWTNDIYYVDERCLIYERMIFDMWTNDSQHMDEGYLICGRTMFVLWTNVMNQLIWRLIHEWLMTDWGSEKKTFSLSDFDWFHDFVFHKDLYRNIDLESDLNANATDWFLEKLSLRLWLWV